MAPLDAENETKFRDYLDGIGAWWHWIDNTWLLATSDKEVTAVKIRDHILRLSPRARAVVFEFPEDITWAASGSKSAKGKTIYDWLKSAWAKER